MDNNEPETRTDRREAEREARKALDAVVCGIKARLDDRQDDAFKSAVMAAMQHLEVNHHPNNLASAQMLHACISCAVSGDEDSAKLILYVSGAILNDALRVEVMRALDEAVRARSLKL